MPGWLQGHTEVKYTCWAGVYMMTPLKTRDAIILFEELRTRGQGFCFYLQWDEALVQSWQQVVKDRARAAALSPVFGGV